jgi:hypothetical protein
VALELNMKSPVNVLDVGSTGIRNGNGLIAAIPPGWAVMVLIGTQSIKVQPAHGERNQASTHTACTRGKAGVENIDAWDDDDHRPETWITRVIHVMLVSWTDHKFRVVKMVAIVEFIPRPVKATIHNHI